MDIYSNLPFDFYVIFVLKYFSGRGFSDVSEDKESTCNTGDMGLIPGSGRSPGVGNGLSLQYSRLENSMGRGAWPAPWGRKESNTTEQLGAHTHFRGRDDGFKTQERDYSIRPLTGFPGTQW